MTKVVGILLLLYLHSCREECHSVFRAVEERMECCTVCIDNMCAVRRQADRVLDRAFPCWTPGTRRRSCGSSTATTATALSARTFASPPPLRHAPGSTAPEMSDDCALFQAMRCSRLTVAPCASARTCASHSAPQAQPRLRLQSWLRVVWRARL